MVTDDDDSCLQATPRDKVREAVKGRTAMKQVRVQGEYEMVSFGCLHICFFLGLPRHSRRR